MSWLTPPSKLRDGECSPKLFEAFVRHIRVAVMVVVIGCVVVCLVRHVYNHVSVYDVCLFVCVVRWSLFLCR